LKFSLVCAGLTKFMSNFPTKNSKRAKVRTFGIYPRHDPFKLWAYQGSIVLKEFKKWKRVSKMVRFFRIKCSCLWPDFEMKTQYFVLFLFKLWKYDPRPLFWYVYWYNFSDDWLLKLSDENFVSQKVRKRRWRGQLHGSIPTHVLNILKNPFGIWCRVSYSLC
jgi:hypothetical protein